MVTGGVKSRRRVLWSASLLLACGIFASAWALVFSPLAVEGPSARGPAGGGGPGSRQAARVEPLDEYAVIGARDLRKPLFDPKPVVKVEPRKPKPKLHLKLTGTAVEPGFTFAAFRTAGGQTRLVGLGETIAGAEVTKIAPDSATLKYHGDLITLTVAGKEGTQ